MRPRQGGWAAAVRVGQRPAESICCVISGGQREGTGCQAYLTSTTCPTGTGTGNCRQRQGQRFRIRCRHPVGTQPTGSGDPGRLGARLSLSWGMPHVLPCFQAETSRGKARGVAPRHDDLAPLPVHQRLQIGVGPAPFPPPAADSPDVGLRDDHDLHLSPQPDLRGKGMIIARNNRPLFGGREPHVHGPSGRTIPNSPLQIRAV